MNWKKIGKTLLLPPVAVLLLLLPVCTIGLLSAMRKPEEIGPMQIAVYPLSFYTLLIWCVRAPKIHQSFRSVQQKNPYIKRWLSDLRLRTNVTLTANTLWNGSYAALQFGLGIYYRSTWFYALGAYYTCLAIMRFFLARHMLQHPPGQKIRQELLRYRACGWILLFMNVALSAIIFLMIRQNRMVRHHEIIVITMAAYTFTALSMAIVNLVRYRKYNSPALSAAKAISLASACVSMLTLENTMLATFGQETMTPEKHRLFLALSGGAVSIFIVMMAIYMLLQANQKIKQLGESRNG